MYYMHILYTERAVTPYVLQELYTHW